MYTVPIACPCLSSPESSVPESDLTGLEICSLKSCLRSGSEGLQGNSLYFIFQSTFGYLILTDANYRQIQITSVWLHSYISVSGPSLFIINLQERQWSQTDTKTVNQISRWSMLCSSPVVELWACSRWSSASLHWQGTGLCYHPKSEGVIQ